jgi:opacity protein-like surface antigen
MNTTTRHVLLAALLGAAAAGRLAGQIKPQGVSLLAYGGGYSALYNVYNLNSGSTDDFKLGFGLGGGAEVRLHEHLAARLTLTGAQSRLRINGAEVWSYLNRYYVGLDAKLRYPLSNGLEPYGLVGGGAVLLHDKGTSGGDQTQGFGHLGIGVARRVRAPFSLFLQGDGYFYSLSGLQGGALSAYSSAQFDILWSAGVSWAL